MKKSFLVYSIIYFGIISIANAQSTLITPGNNQPNINATSTTAGVNVPRVSLTGVATAAPVVSPTEGLLVYNIGNAITKGFYYWNGASWALLGISSPALTASAPLNIATNNIKINSGTQVGQLLTWDGNNWVNTNPKPTTIINNMPPFLTLNYCIATQGIFPSRNSADPFLGEIELYAFNFDPVGFAFCNGQLLSISQNSALFALLGTIYGGNGQTTFALPDLRGRSAIHQGQGTGLTNRVIGSQGGTETNSINDKY